MPPPIKGAKIVKRKGLSYEWSFPDGKYCSPNLSSLSEKRLHNVGLYNVNVLQNQFVVRISAAWKPWKIAYACELPSKFRYNQMWEWARVDCINTAREHHQLFQQQHLPFPVRDGHDISFQFLVRKSLSIFIQLLILCSASPKSRQNVPAKHRYQTIWEASD
jgi:hypothetical protein